MRTSYKSAILRTPNSGEVFALNFGADYCAEHEWGIAGINRSFGIAGPTREPALKDVLFKPRFGIETRRITVVPDEVHLVEINTKKHKGLLLYYTGWTNDSQGDELLRDFHLSLYGDRTLTCAWDERSFGVFVTKPEDQQALRDIHNAILNKDAAIWIAGGGVFQNPGLVIGIISRVSEDLKFIMGNTDQEYYDLQVAMHKTGVPKLLEKANGGKTGYFAPFAASIRPAWNRGQGAEPGEKKPSSHPVVFWVNPHDKGSNYGWFTAEEIEAWTRGEGPIPKQSKAS